MDQTAFDAAIVFLLFDLFRNSRKNQSFLRKGSLYYFLEPAQAHSLISSISKTIKNVFLISCSKYIEKIERVRSTRNKYKRHMLSAHIKNATERTIKVMSSNNNHSVNIQQFHSSSMLQSTASK